MNDKELKKRSVTMPSYIQTLSSEDDENDNNK